MFFDLGNAKSANKKYLKIALSFSTKRFKQIKLTCEWVSE